MLTTTQSPVLSAASAVNMKKAESLDLKEELQTPRTVGLGRMSAC